jgi:hypothetical protein
VEADSTAAVFMPVGDSMEDLLRSMEGVTGAMEWSTLDLMDMLAIGALTDMLVIGALTDMLVIGALTDMLAIGAPLGDSAGGSELASG